MDKETIKKAEEIIASKANYIGDSMEGYAVLALNDESGYPSASALTIAKSDGIKMITFTTKPDSNKAMRVAKCNRASVCIASKEYNITLVGKIEIVENLEDKRNTWCEPMQHMWSGYDDPTFCVLRFSTERYSIFLAYDDEAAKAIGEI